MESQLEQLKKLISVKKFGQAKNIYLRFDNELEKKESKLACQIRLNLLNDYCIQLLEKGHKLCGSKFFGFMPSLRKEKGGLRAFEDIINYLRPPSSMARDRFCYCNYLLFHIEHE